VGDPAARAVGAGEPALGAILREQGYTIDVGTPEVAAQLFVRAGPGPVTHRPLAAFGLKKICSGGWYRAAEGKPEKQSLWRVAGEHNKQQRPPLMAGSATTFDPGAGAFGVWVSTAGFTDETVYSQDALQRFIKRFGANHHKAHIYAAKKGGKVVPSTYLIGWEYSTNDDNQDMVTLLTNVRPVAK